ncbi:hypothetical protein D3C72_1037780 [compost metagenome]
MKLENRVGVQRADAGQLNREIRLIQLRVDLFNDVALVRALETGHGVAAGLVVGRHHHHALHAQFIRGDAGGVGVRVVLEGDREVVRVAGLARVVGGAGVQADVEAARVQHRGANRRHDV